MNHPSLEHQLLFRVLKGENIILPEGLDVDLFLQLFQRHRLLPISEAIRKLLPEEKRTLWKQSVQQYMMHSLIISAETLDLITSLKKAGITALPLKGAVLASRLYGDVGFRQFNDIDLLIANADLEKAKEIVLARNYTQAYPNTLSGSKRRVYENYKKDIGFSHKEKRVFLELHYGIYVHELLSKKNEQLIRTSTEKISVMLQEVEVFDKESTFIYLVYHGCLHQYFRLFWLRDVAECLKKWDLDHRFIFEQMEKLGLERMLGLSLVMANHYFGVSIPPEYNRLLADRKKYNRLINICHERINGSETGNTRSKLLKHIFLLSLKPGIRYKWKVLWSIVQRWRIKVFMGGH